MATADDLLSSAKRAGAAGDTWSSWANSDAVQDFCFGAEFEALPQTERDALTARFEAEFQAGVREHRLANGWVARWTTAPKDYDTFGTETLADGGSDYFGKAVRQVLVDGEFLGHQEMRYGSGCHGVWERDPRELEAQRQATLAAEATERRAWEAKRTAGLEWLATLTVAQLEALIDDAGEFAAGDALPARALQYADARAALRAKREALELGTRATEWARCRAILPDGSILVDDGENRTGPMGRIHRPPHVYFNVQTMGVSPAAFPHPDAKRHSVISSSGDVPGHTLAEVVELIQAGRLRMAKPEEVPPHSVLARLGHERLREIRRYEVDGQVVWVGPAAAFTREPMVLDERGRIVRKKVVASTAAQRFHAEQ